MDDRLPHLGEVGAELLEDLGGDPFALADQPEKDVLGADVVVTELQRLAEGQLENLLGPGGEGDVPAGRLLALADDLHDLVTHAVEVDPQGSRGRGRRRLPPRG